MKSKIYSSEYVKVTSKGQMWIPVFLAIGFLMAFPVAELLKMGNWFGMEYTHAQIELLYENLWKDGFLGTGYLVTVIAAVLNGISQFWYQYSSRKVDFYHCLPVKRSNLFLHKTYVGILYYLIPYLVMEFFSICIGAMRGFFSLHLMKLALILLLLHLVLYLMLYFSVVLVLCVTGNLLMGALCMGALALYGPILSGIIQSYQASFFYTYSGNSYGITEILENYVSPFILGYTFTNRYAAGKSGKLLAVILIVTLVMAACSYFAYVKRPAEGTGKALVFPWTEVVLRFLVVIPAGLGVGIIFHLLPVKDDNRLPWWIFGMIVGTFLVHGILEVIFQMDFRKFLSHKLQLGLCSVFVALIAINYQFDLQGYDAYMPAQDEIETIMSNLGNGYENFQLVEDKGGYYAFNDYGYDSKLGSVHNVGIDQGIYQTLEEISRSVNEAGKQMKDEDTWDYYDSYKIQYVLKSGKSVYRDYHMSTDQAKTFLTACYEEGTLKEEKYSSLCIDTKFLPSISGNFYDGNSYTLFQGDKNKRKALIEAVQEDVKEAGASVLTGEPCAMLNLTYENVPERTSITNMVPKGNSMRYVYTNVYVYPEFKRTVAILKETGYPLSIDDVQVDQVEIRYWIADSYEETETIVYSDEEQIQELKKALVPYGLSCDWETYRGNWSSLKVVINGTNNEGGWRLKEDACPGFLKEDEKRARPDLVD